jgi:hypothetical protein
LLVPQDLGEEISPGEQAYALDGYTRSSEPYFAYAYVSSLSTSFTAFKLPGRGTLSMHGLHLTTGTQSQWQRFPESTTVRVFVARSLRIGGQPVEELLSQPLTIDAAVDIEMGEVASKQVAKWLPRPDSNVDIDFDLESSWIQTISVPSPPKDEVER